MDKDLKNRFKLWQFVLSEYPQIANMAMRDDTTLSIGYTSLGTMVLIVSKYIDSTIGILSHKFVYQCGDIVNNDDYNVIATITIFDNGIIDKVTSYYQI